MVLFSRDICFATAHVYVRVVVIRALWLDVHFLSYCIQLVGI